MKKNRLVTYSQLLLQSNHFFQIWWLYLNVASVFVLQLIFTDIFEPLLIPHLSSVHLVYHILSRSHSRKARIKSCIKPSQGAPKWRVLQWPTTLKHSDSNGSSKTLNIRTNKICIGLSKNVKETDYSSDSQTRGSHLVLSDDIRISCRTHVDLNARHTSQNKVRSPYGSNV